MAPDRDREARFRAAQQEHTAFKQQCAQFRAHAKVLLAHIRHYHEQLHELHQHASGGANLPPDEIPTRIAAVAQQLQDAEIELHELRFEFTDLTAKYQDLRSTPFP